MTAPSRATILAGIPATNLSLYRKIRFVVGDPTALIELDGKSTLILRDIEMDRARANSRADAVACPADYTPSGGLSGDRETATAQAAGEFLRRAGVAEVVADRSLPLIFASLIEEAGVKVRCDRELGVIERRQKDRDEIELLREAQALTEEAMTFACGIVARATAGSDGVLSHEGEILTSEGLRVLIDLFLLERGYFNPGSIVAGGPVGSDCHHHGTGPLRTGQPVIVDIFPRNKKTLYYGDCTRTVVHGDIPDEIQRMHRAVEAAKEAATLATRAGVTGEEVHAATSKSILASGFAMGLPGPDDPDSYCAMVHGTGHGIGLEVHEPPLLDRGGPPLLVGDALTIEPGLYSRALGGVRLEDMVIVTETGTENLNRLPFDLDWS